jgi:GT2 family glycosyltransferase
MSKVYIIVLNWNGWEDTIECLDSIFRSDYLNCTVVVCDNNSEDQSLEYIKSWAEGNMNFSPRGKTPLNINRKDIKWPISYAEYSREEAICTNRSIIDNVNLILIQTGTNLGFAGGNNVGLRHIMGRPDFEYVWILNNDTVVSESALSEMVQVSSQDSYDRPVGSYHYNYLKPQYLEMVAGLSIDRYFAVRPTFEKDIRRVDFLSGASLFMSRKLLGKLGLIPEEYFLNFEDLEYTYSYKTEFIKYNPNVEPFLAAGTIWHKESATQGKNQFLQSYYFTRNALYSSAKIGNLKLLLTFLYALLRIVYASLLGKFSLAKGIVAGIFAFIRKNYGAYHNPS